MQSIFWIFTLEYMGIYADYWPISALMNGGYNQEVVFNLITLISS